MSSGHTHNRNGRGNQRRRHGPPRQQPQNGQPQNGQPQNGQPQNSSSQNVQPRPPHGNQATSTRPTPAMSMTTMPTRPEAPFQSPEDLSRSGDEPFMIIESVTAEIREVTLEVEVEPPPTRERPAPPPPRSSQQRNTQPPGKRGPILVPSERQSGADTGARSNGHASQPGMQTPAIPHAPLAPHVQPAPAEPFAASEPQAPSGPPRLHQVEHDMSHPRSYVMQQSGAGDTDDEDAGYTPHERRPLHDVRGDVGALIDSLHDLFSQDRGIASQGNATRCGICYLHYLLSELEYREVEGYYVCVDCKRTLGSTTLMMVRRQQKN